MKHWKNKHEGRMTRMIESETSKLPSGAFLTAALGAMGASLILKCMNRNASSIFVGQWAAPLLIMGVYDKIVKTQGHGRRH